MTHLSIFRDASRRGKPREDGLTHVMDSGMSISQIESLIEVAEPHVDILKFGWATSVVVANLEAKLALLRDRPIRMCCGGSLFELAVAHGKVHELVGFFKEAGFKLVEVSDGTVDYPRKDKLRYIELLAKDFTVLSEVGRKDRRKALRAPHQWITQISEDLSAGAWKVIAEGRESGNVGLFNEDGSVQVALVEEIASKIDVKKLIFEAPQREQQVYMVRMFGNNVNLGNIAPNDVISLETIRQGLRGETMTETVLDAAKR